MAQPSWIGKKIGGRYEIEELLGQGGMSSVYKGTDPNLRRTVAVKMIHPHLVQDEQFVSRFEEEAAAVARLKHPNIIQVFDFNHDDDVYFMVLEHVDGETLQERLQALSDSGDRLAVEEAVQIAASVCDALEYAHNRDMVHRDIKPANIMINEAGQAVLMDFGVAKIIGGKDHTATGAVVGTALYISPEQVRGQDPDRRVDIYALGVTLFEMLSGEPPFEADSAMSTMMMHVNEPVPDIRQLNSLVPSSLVEVIEKALAKDRDERYATAADLARALRSADLSPADQDKTTVEELIDAPAQVPPGGTVVEEPLPGEEVEKVAPEPEPAPTPSPAARAPEPAPDGGSDGPSRGLLAAGAVVGAIVICGVLAGGGYLLFGGSGGGLPALAAASETPTEAPTAISEPTEAPTATTAPPTETPAPTVEPTATDPTGSYVRINSITLQGNRYLVEYETFGYIENLPGQHVHFYFNSVPEEQAGSPGSGPWYVWGGPRPFNGYTTSDRPAGADQMCARSANPDHSIVMGSGNCVDLPDG